MATPTCVQHVLTNSNENFENGNGFIVRLPEPTLANNCIVLFLTYGYSASRTVTITDDQSSSWPAATRTVNDTGNVLTTAVFVLPNCAAGIRAITVTFNASLQGFQASASEWYNVATSSPGDGSNGATSATPAASGSFTTTTNGDLILHYAIGSGWGRPLNAGEASDCTTLTKASGYTKLHASRQNMCFVEYLVQTTAGATNPSASFSGGTSNTEPVNSITLALKNASAGTAPSATDIRVRGLIHGALPDVASSGNYTVWTPFAGNLAVLITSYPSTGLPINSGTLAVGGSMTLVAPGAPGASPQAVYKTGMTSSDDDVLTLNVSTGSSGKLQYMVYDVVNAGAYDTQANVALGSFGAGSIPHCPDITPGVSTGLTIATAEFGTGPPSACTSPSGARFDCGFYTGYTDLSPWDSGDAHGHIRFTSNAAQNWTWTDTQATGNANGLALTFAESSSTTNATGTPSGASGSGSVGAIAPQARPAPPYTLATITG